MKSRLLQKFTSKFLQSFVIVYLITDLNTAIVFLNSSVVPKRHTMHQAEQHTNKVTGTKDSTVLLE